MPFRSFSLLLACAAIASTPLIAQDIVRDAPGSALYIPPINPIPHWYEVRGGSWPVPPDILQKMVKLVDAEIGRNKHFNPANPMSDYVVQFRGEQRNGRQIVRLAGGCRGFGENAWRLSERFDEVFDGGKCYFDAEYTPADGQFVFSYHGYA